MVTRELDAQQNTGKNADKNSLAQSQFLKKVIRPTKIEIQRQDAEVSSDSQIGSKFLQER